jgi:hypothetical protein
VGIMSLVVSGWLIFYYFTDSDFLDGYLRKIPANIFKQ